MRLRVKFQDGLTGGFLTTECSASSYGQPVFVPDAFTETDMPEGCYGPHDLLSFSPLKIMGAVEPETLERLQHQGWQII